MKNSRRFISAVMALSMLSAIAPMSAFAADADRITIDQNSTEKKGTMTATYDVQAKYTVTIPAGVTLDSTNAVSKKIEASDVILAKGQKIKVTLNSANHTASGETFHAQTDNGDSTATYTIGKGEATEGVKVGDVVAEFTENGDQTLTFSKAEGATYAGTHTETLTFGIEVENSVESVLAPALENGAKIKFEYKYNGRYTTYFEFTNNNGSYTLSPLEEDDDEFNTTNLSVKADNPNVLILDVVCAIGTRRLDSFCSTIEFDTTDNTFKFTNRGATSTNPPRICDLISVSVNDTDVTDKLTDESTDKS